MVLNLIGSRLFRIKRGFNLQVRKKKCIIHSSRPCSSNQFFAKLFFCSFVKAVRFCFVFTSKILKMSSIHLETGSGVRILTKLKLAAGIEKKAKLYAD